jgi:hypothetical protein
MELRLEPAIIEKVDSWRSEQPGLPGRSEAIRRLIEAGIGTSAAGQAYTAVKLQIVTTALTPGLGNKVSDAYLYAWSHDVYPLMHDSVDWHKPFASCFSVSSEMVDELSRLLDDGWQKKKIPSFYKLEDYYDVRLGNTEWSRSSLMRACRYMYLADAFDQNFWKGVLKKTEHPLEAGSMTSAFQRGEITIG